MSSQDRGGEHDASRADYVAVPLTEDMNLQKRKNANEQTTSPDILSNSAIPPILSYCVASITMTVVNKVCTWLSNFYIS